MTSHPLEQTYTSRQASFADLLFSPVDESISEPSLSKASFPATEIDVEAILDFHSRYALPERETTLVSEDKERGKWSCGKSETESERVARIEAQQKHADETHNKVEAGLRELAISLAEGKSEPLLAFLDSLSRFHRYSWGNTLLIELQRPDATLVAGFTTWKELDRHVKAGEKGIAILAPIVKRIQVETDEESESGSGETELKLTGKTKTTSDVWGFKVVYVFDVKQTDGKPLPEFASVKGNPSHNLPRLKSLMEEEGIILDYKDDLGGALGRSYGGRIAIKSHLPGAAEFSVLAHELAHELLHPPALRAEIPKTVKETEAEAVSYVVSRAVGLEPGTASSDYIHLYRGDAATLAASLERIQKTATRILSYLEAGTALQGGNSISRL